MAEIVKKNPTIKDKKIIFWIKIHLQNFFLTKIETTRQNIKSGKKKKVGNQKRI